MAKRENNEDLIQNFYEIQRSFGLSHQLYEAKFVYCYQQNPGSEAYLLSTNQPLKSQSVGFSLQDIRVVHALAAQMIYQAGKALKIPISTTILAQSLFHFFYAQKTYIQYDIRDAIIGTVYLACKSEQTLRKGYQIVLIFDYIFKIFEGQKQVSHMQIDGMEYTYMKNKVVEAQLKILFDLGFQIYRLKDLPHRYIGALLGLFDKHPNINLISKQAWKTLNDIYLTTACVYYTPQILAAAAVFIALRKTDSSFGTIPWWILMETRISDIEKVQLELEALKQVKQIINVQYVSERISQVAENYHNLVNVFPVFYHRKIWLDKNDMLCIQKQQFAKKMEKKTKIQSNIIQIAHLSDQQSSQNPDNDVAQQSQQFKNKEKKKKNKHRNQKDRIKKKKDKKKKSKQKNRQQHKSRSSSILSERNKQRNEIQKLQPQKFINKEKQQISVRKQSQNSEENEKNSDKKAGLNLNLSKTNLLTSINKQLVKHKQRVQQREQQLATELNEVFQKNEQKHQKLNNDSNGKQNIEMGIQNKKNQQNSDEDSDDEQLRLIQQLKKKVKLNRKHKLEQTNNQQQ